MPWSQQTASRHEKGRHGKTHPDDSDQISKHTSARTAEGKTKSPQHLKAGGIINSPHVKCQRNIRQRSHQKLLSVLDLVCSSFVFGLYISRV